MRISVETHCFEIQIKENDQGVIVDVFKKINEKRELLTTDTYWNMDVEEQ